MSPSSPVPLTHEGFASRSSAQRRISSWSVRVADFDLLAILVSSLSPDGMHGIRNMSAAVNASNICVDRCSEKKMNGSGFDRFVRKMMPVTSAILLLVLLYVGWIFYSRRRDMRDAEARAEAAEAQNAKYTVDKYGGGRVKILAFSLSSGAIHRGQSVQLCYGVANAKTVKIEPPVGETWPSMSRCLDVTPKKDTSYVITAQDEAGHNDTAQLAIKVVKKRLLSLRARF